MKKIGLITLCAIFALQFASCTKTDYTSFVGTWGVEKIQYYNIDYAGNPIAASVNTYTFNPNDINNGIQLVFNEDKSGEMRDNAVDTVWYNWNDETHVYDSYIVNPDTTLVTHFTYSYDVTEHILYMNMQYENALRTFSMNIESMSKDAFVYENEYDKDYVEKAYLKRLSKMPTKSASRQTPKHPHMPGSFLGGR